MVGCINRHPNNNLTNFTNQLHNIIKSFNPNKYDLFLFGDINIDFMKANFHPETDEYLNMLFFAWSVANSYQANSYNQPFCYSY